jgi:hypothetical protein
MAHDKGSFSYRVVNKQIRDVLDARSMLDNTVQVAMPFVKATTTLMDGDKLGFTLGLHAINEDVKYENIYSSGDDSGMPLLGYTYLSDGTNERVYADDPAGKITSRAYDLRSSLFTNTNFTKIPPPGITKVTIGRNKSGLLAFGQLEISVPSLIQLEGLHRNFLVPGVGMVLEWGQQFATTANSSDYGELTNISDNLFPWHDREKVIRLLTEKLALNKVGMDDIINDYVIPSQGQYMWMFGRVAGFNTKSNPDGSFNCTVKIVGPSEDSWAYSTINTVTPAKDDTTKYFCTDTNSVFSYFSKTTSGGLNFKTLLDNTKDGKGEAGSWQNHVQYFGHGNKQAGEPTSTDAKPNISEDEAGFGEDAYFISWRFFVNVVLNDPNVGIKSIFAKVQEDKELEKLGLLLPYAVGDTRSDTNIAKLAYINDPYESYVGMNKFLRSVRPDTMIIVNESAAKEAEKNPNYNLPTSGQTFYAKTDQTRQFYDDNATKEKGLFDQSTFAVSGSAEVDRGFLSAGVWLNHKAVIECMLSGNTILRGITNLLDRMNLATQNYWKLTLDVAHPVKEYGHSYNYMVVDANFRESSDLAVKNFINDVHVFNKYTRVTETGKLVGSELIDCTVDLSLPKLMFAQIANGGLVQAADIENLANLNKSQEQIAQEKTATNSAPTDYAKSAKISDPNDSLREMFAITSLLYFDKATRTYDSTKQGPDITTIPKTKHLQLLKAAGTCGQSPAQTPAQTGGHGNQTAGTSITTSTTTNENTELIKNQKTATDYLQVNEAVCTKCPAIIESRGGYGGTPDVVSGGAAPKTLAQVMLDVASYITFKNDSGLIPESKMWPLDLLITQNQPLTQLGLGVGGVGVHKNGSAHYTGQAIDIPVHNDINAKAVLEFWKSRGGYEVLDEYSGKNNGPKLNHIHIEWNAIKEVTAIPTPPSATPTAALTDEEKKQCAECNRHQQMLTQANAKLTEMQNTVDTKLRQFPGLQSLFRYIEVFPEYMVAAIANEANGVYANAFGASPGALSITADFSLPGIAGLRVGELFWIDRLPAFYKAFGAFQIMSIEETIGPDGWQTNVHATFNYLGKKWKDAMFKILNEARPQILNEARQQ